MRELLETFRLPGESQPISRITEVFAEQLFSTSPRKLGVPPLRLKLTLQRRSPAKMPPTS